MQNLKHSIEKTIYISNLSKYVRDKDLVDIFQKYGKIEHTNVVRDPTTRYVANSTNSIESISNDSPKFL